MRRPSQNPDTQQKITGSVGSDCSNNLRYFSPNPKKISETIYICNAHLWMCIEIEENDDEHTDNVDIDGEEDEN